VSAMPKDEYKIYFKNKEYANFSHVRIDSSRVKFNIKIIADIKTEKVTTHCHEKCSILLGSVVAAFVWDFLET
jgi:hypothetical protein